MTITFISNYLNHHQKPFCDAMYERIENGFTFISTIPTPEERLRRGYSNYSNEAYNLLSYQAENEDKTNRLINTSDLVIFGACPFNLVKKRINANKLTYRYSERLLKKSRYQKFNPRTILFLLRFHTKYRNKNLHLLCASAFLPNDMNWVFAYPQKKYKWGYFTQVNTINVKKTVIKKNKNEIVELLWVARFIDWKHPELPIKLAIELKKKGYNFKLSMIGDGILHKNTKLLAQNNHLNDCIDFIGNIPNKEVLKMMDRANILLFTSDRSEGWGAVVNEGMSSGCTVVASSEMGSVPYLIKPGHNGLVFKSNNIDSLVCEVEKVIENKELRTRLAINAYKSMSEKWSPNNAASNLIELTQSLLENKRIDIKEGPCSIAHYTSMNWYKF